MAPIYSTIKRFESDLIYRTVLLSFLLAVRRFPTSLRFRAQKARSVDSTGLGGYLLELAFGRDGRLRSLNVRQRTVRCSSYALAIFAPRSCGTALSLSGPVCLSAAMIPEDEAACYSLVVPHHHHPTELDMDLRADLVWQHLVILLIL